MGAGFFRAHTVRAEEGVHSGVGDAGEVVVRRGVQGPAQVGGAGEQGEELLGRHRGGGRAPAAGEGEAGQAVGEGFGDAVAGGASYEGEQVGKAGRLGREEAADGAGAFVAVAAEQVEHHLPQDGLEVVAGAGEAVEGGQVTPDGGAGGGGHGLAAQGGLIGEVVVVG